MGFDYSFHNMLWYLYSTKWKVRHYFVFLSVLVMHNHI